MDPAWFAIWTRSRHEKIVRDQLEKKSDVDVFLPTIGKWSRWKDRKKKIDWPLFPGYVFARFVADERVGILKVDGVVQIISNNGMLSSIPDEEIDSIRTLVESELAYDPVPLIKEGDMVKVTSGPLKGVVGRLITKKGASARLVLSVDLIGQAVSVEVDAADVKPYLSSDKVTSADLRHSEICNEDRPRFELDSPFVVSPMAGMTDTAFRRLVKRQGGCGLVVSEMVSSEGLVRGIDRTLEYAEYTEEERPVSIQIFGGEPAKMAEAARVVEQMGANIVDVNMGCPVPKIAKHHAGCSLMREPAHAAEIIAAMSKAVKIPVTVKMRKGWDEDELNAGELAKRVEGAGAKAITIHGRTAKQSYSGVADWDFVTEIAKTVSIPVFGSGDCIEPEDIVDADEVRCQRRVCRPRRAAQSVDPRAGARPDGRPSGSADQRRRARPVPARLHAAVADGERA